MDYKMETQYETYQNAIGNQIADIATRLVASRDCTVPKAIKMASDYVQRQQESSDDATGTFDTLLESHPPAPDREVPAKQFEAVRAKLIDQAMEAAQKFH